MRKLRIAQVTNLQESVPPLNKNGLEQVVYYLTEELVKMGHDVTLFGTADSNTSAKLAPVWPVAISRDENSSLYLPSMLNKFAVATVFARADEFDIIHDHTRFFAPFFAQFISTPIVSTLHHPVSYLWEEGYKAKLDHDYLSCLAVWQSAREKVSSVVVSHFQAKQYTGVCQVIHNGLDLADWPFSETGGEYLAFLGYITPDKGAAEAIQVVLPTKEKLLIAGPIRGDDPRAKRYFKEKIEPFLNDRIRYIGPLGYKEKQDFLRKAKMTLMPIQWDEPFGLVAIESLASGTPVIAWNRAAMPEIIEDGVSGYLVNSVGEMTERIERVGKLSRPGARKRVEENFSARKMAEKYVGLYESLRE